MILQSIGEIFAVTGIPPTPVGPIYAGPVTNGWQMLLVALPALLAFLTSCIATAVSVKNQRKITETAGTIQELHILVNSRLDALVEATRRSAHAEGVIEGKRAAKAAEAARLDEAAKNLAKDCGSAEPTKIDPKPEIGFVPDTRPSG
jgi:hypothetical protein